MCEQTRPKVFQFSNGSGGLYEEPFRVDDRAKRIADASRKGEFISYKSLLAKHPDFGLKFSMHDFQVSGMLYFLYGKRGILADATGLGKTVQCLGLFQFLEQYTDEDNRWVIVVPPSVVYQWDTEFRKFTDFRPVVAMGDRQARIPYYLSPNWQFLITTYHLLWRDWEMIKDLEMKNWVFDDAHFFKNHDTKTAGIVKDLTLNANRVILATATPIQKTPTDIHSLMEALHATHDFGSRVGFEHHYCVIRKTRQTRRDGRGYIKSEFIKARNTTELRDKLKPYCLKRTFDAVGDVLPALTVQPVWLDMHKKQSDMYKQTKTKLIKAHDQGTLRKVKNSGYHKMRQICAGTRTAGFREDTSPKLDMVEFFLAEKLGKGEKVVIYAYYKATVRTLVERLERLRSKGVYSGSWVTMTGDDRNMAHREAAKQKFTNNPNCKVLIGTDAIQVGMNLQAARYLIMLDWIPNAKNIEQLVGRVRRMGGHSHVVVYPILMRKSIEESLWRRTRFEAVMNDAIFDERGDIFNFSDDEFMKMLQEF